jgi:hypothetical protein
MHGPVDLQVLDRCMLHHVCLLPGGASARLSAPVAGAGMIGR